MKIRTILAGLALAALAQPAMAQEPKAVLHAAYALWGMMDGAANFCWEVADYDVRYMEAHQNWLANNIVVRDELDATGKAIGAGASLAADAEAFGSKGILEILNKALNPKEACGNWYELTLAGRYDAEVFMAE